MPSFGLNRAVDWTEVCGRCGLIVRSIGLDRAVDWTEVCGRCGAVLYGGYFHPFIVFRSKSADSGRKIKLLNFKASFQGQVI